jgi:mannose-6-phosphate isomerase-like protein (cupin superfamily)
VAHRLQFVDQLAQGGLADPGAAGEDGRASAAGIEVGEDGAVLGPELVALPGEPIDELRLERLEGALTIIAQECPPDFAAPMHIHRREDEVFYVVEGAVRVTCEHRTWVAGAGAILPKGRPHRFAVREGRPARLLQITAPAQFERFVAEVGVPATRPGLPDPEPPDLDRLLAAARHGIDILPGDG